MKKHLFTTMIITAGLSAGALGQSTDWRLLENGIRIHEDGYIDQPYVAEFDDGTWVVVFTTGRGSEGATGQHVVASTSTDQGGTWSDPVQIEPPDGPAASWAVPYITDYGRLYAFYSYNGDEVGELKGEAVHRTDMLGWYCYRYSDDKGKTWSERYRLPMRVTAADRNNDWEGEVQIFWGIDEPVDVEDGVMFGFTKLGKYIQDLGEGWFYRCDNIHTERDPEKLAWRLLPEGDHGVRNPAFGSVQEEFNMVQLDNGDLYTVYRTTNGHPAVSRSENGGNSWSMPEYMRYADGRPVKTPRACPRIWKTDEGRYLFWYHNHSGQDYSQRNPAWMAGGIEKDGDILWSQPEIVLYSHDISDESGRFSYPDLVQADNRYWVTETNKETGRIHRLDTDLIEGLWRQFEAPEVVREGLVDEVGLSDMAGERVRLQGLGGLDSNAPTGGITFNFRIDEGLVPEGRILFDSRNPVSSNGYYLRSTGYRRLEFGFCARTGCESWTTDPGLLPAYKEHEVTVILDNGPGIFLFVVDGRLCDGGEGRQYGWTRYRKIHGKITSGREASVLTRKVKAIRVWDRVLSVSEAINDQRTRLIQ